MDSFIDLTAADGHRLKAWRDGPEGADPGKTPGLVVVQEIFGVNGHMRNVCARFAAAGYAVVAPALFDRAERGVELGYTADDVARGRDLRAKVSDAAVMLDIDAAALALGGRAKLGIVGYCWGGTIAWWGATRTRHFQAACGWYGGGIAGTRTEAPHCPVQLHFGEKDSGIPLSDVELIRAAQPAVEIFVYPGAQHGFGCDERGSFSAPDARLAQERTLAFLGRTLMG
ncbi:MAG: dienelactone hydrolase family protein [Rhodospirillales bacterium]|nr:dienelactone hydrolase family protein [Rhodospirillales bacterium]MDE2198425.1 dienelactone hydrolase family protein [Rhodospirillales bacterium]MDE2574859.1 dienelactone hydrolase family protein [Rhodospirillales bacterium]